MGIILFVSAILYYTLLKYHSQSTSFIGVTLQSLSVLVYGFSLFAGPFLAIRAVYFLIKMIKEGRRPGVRLFSVQLLFNPFNLLIFPSLLNDQGLLQRRRCLVALTLFVLLLGLMVLIISALA
jgi:hypothetical protein